MRRLLPIALLCLAGVTAAPASTPDAPHWHGIWMSGYNVFQISTGPAETVQVAAAAYKQLGAKSYLETQAAFMVVPTGATIDLSSASGCAIQLSYAGGQITAHDNGKCGPDTVSFDGTYTRQ